jgi:hypothetical protein
VVFSFIQCRMALRHWIILWVFLPGLWLQGAGETFAVPPGTVFETFTVGPTTYRQVKVLSVNARTLVIRHEGGMASIRLHDLAPDWQARFHYDPAAEATAEQLLQAKPKPVVTTARPVSGKGGTRLETLLQQFGKPAEVRAEVDLRPEFFQLQLGVKDQGHRPSCSVFAVVSALEFQNAKLAGKAEKFSEEYLVWAVRQTVQRLPGGNAVESAEDQDEGFSLSEVVAALRAYGIPLQASMPNTFGSKITAIESPPAAIVEEARTHQRVFVHLVPGRDAPTRINNVVLALNAGVPVPIGVAWPNYRTMRTGYLSGQKPMAGAGHAITLVGYKSSTGKLEDAVFIFKNSWGVDWGQGGYGTVTYGYLSRYLNDVILLEVQRG